MEDIVRGKLHSPLSAHGLWTLHNAALQLEEGIGDTEMAEALREIHDRRRQSGNFRHRLIDIVVIALVSMIAGEDDMQ